MPRLKRDPTRSILSRPENPDGREARQHGARCFASLNHVANRERAALRVPLIARPLRMNKQLSGGIAGNRLGPDAHSARSVLAGSILLAFTAGPIAAAHAQTSRIAVALASTNAS